MKITGKEIIIFDNGSLRPDSIIAFRRFAHKLSQYVEEPIHSAGLLHSHKVSSDQLNGISAWKLEDLIRNILKNNSESTEFVLLPFFIGESRAISEYLPKVLTEIKKDYSTTSFRLAYPLSGQDPLNPDIRIAKIFQHSVSNLITEEKKVFRSIGISIVDHGTPAIEVNHIRNALRAQLNFLLNEGQSLSYIVEAYSMERREGDEYAFNEPLLEKIHKGKAIQCDFSILAPLFLLPGRHAGDGGDVEEILLQSLKKKLPQTPLLHNSVTTLEILKDRLTGCLHSPFLQI